MRKKSLALNSSPPYINMCSDACIFISPYIWENSSPFYTQFRTQRLNAKFIQFITVDKRVQTFFTQFTHVQN